MARKPGEVRDAIIEFISGRPKKEASVSEIYDAVCKKLGDVPRSSVRSYLRLNTPNIFKRTDRGRYKLLDSVR